MKSKIDPNLNLCCDVFVLSVVKHNEHAMFLLEELNDGEYLIRKIHFIPKGHSYCFLYGADLQQVIGNGVVDGEVASFSLSMEKPHISCTREDIFTRLKLNKFEGKSWSLTRSQLTAMMDAVHRERDPKNTPKFNIKGRVRSEEPGHNCCTWVIEKAQLAGIDVTPYLVKGIVAYSLRLPDLTPKQSCIVS